jgi:hypothetical protein
MRSAILGLGLVVLGACGTPARGYDEPGTGGSTGASGIPTSRDPLLTWLRAGSYASFAHESTTKVSDGPHKIVRTYVNPTLAASLASGAATHPVGAGSVKEIYDANMSQVGWAVSVKVAADSHGGQGWYWLESQDGVTINEGTAAEPGCAGCHAVEATDFVKTKWPLK